MISRKRILSNSCTQLSFGSGGPNEGSFAEDVWFDKDSLYQDHIREILNKQNQLDDEIWGKIICMERNRRVAKAYARSPVITINNGSIGFDGDSIGLRGFDNPYRDTEILVTHKLISSGLAIGVDEVGNILVQLIEQRTLYLRQFNLSCADESIIKKKGKLKPGYVYKIFCIKKFLTKLNQLQCNSFTNGTSGGRNGKSHSIGSLIALNKSSNRRSNNISAAKKQHNSRHKEDADRDDESFISRISLENQCFSIISLSSHEEGQMEPLMDTPVWIIVINIIALEMLHRNLNLMSNSSSSDLASSLSCSSRSTSGSDVERMDKLFHLIRQPKKYTGNNKFSTGLGNNLSNSPSNCTRCSSLSELNVFPSRKCPSSNGSNSSNKIKSVGKSNTGHRVHHQLPCQPHHHLKGHGTSSGEFSSSSSSGYAMSSETTSSTKTQNGPTTTKTMSTSSESNGENGRLVKRNIDDHFAGQLTCQSDQQFNSKTKYLLNCDTNKVVNKFNSLSPNSTSMSKSVARKSQFNSNRNTKSNLSNNFTFDDGHNDSYNCNSTSSGGTFNGHSNCGQGTNCNLPLKVKSTDNNRHNKSNNSSTTTTTTTTMTTTNAMDGNLAVQGLAKENQLTKSTNDSKALKLGTRSQCDLPHVPDGKSHRQPQLYRHQVSMSGRSSKLNPHRLNNDHSKSSCIDLFNWAIPTPDYDDSGNENYGFIGAKSAFGGQRWRLSTSNLLLDENIYHWNHINLPSNYTGSPFEPRLSQSTNYLSSDHGDRDRDQEEEDEVYAATAMVKIDSMSRIINSALCPVPKCISETNEW